MHELSGLEAICALSIVTIMIPDKIPIYGMITGALLGSLLDTHAPQQWHT